MGNRYRRVSKPVLNDAVVDVQLLDRQDCGTIVSPSSTFHNQGMTPYYCSYSLVSVCIFLGLKARSETLLKESDNIFMGDSKKYSGDPFNNSKQCMFT